MQRRTLALILTALCALHLSLSGLLTRSYVFEKYPDAAALFHAGKLAADERTDFSPLYLLANVALPPLALRTLQPIAWATVIVAVFLYLRRRVSAGRALLGAALVAVSQSALVYGAVLEPDLWNGVLLSWLLLLADARARTDARDRWQCLAAGALAGLSIALRPSNLLWAVPLLCLCAWRIRSKPRALVISALAVLLCGATAILPSEYVQSRSSDPSATMSVGAVLHMGNRPESPGIGANPPLLMKLYELQLASRDRPDYVHALYRQFARLEGGEAQAGALELRWVRRTCAFFAREPAGALALWARKATFFWLAPDAHDLTDARGLDTKFPVPLVPTSLLAMLALMGCVRAGARREDAGPVIGAVAIFATCLIFYVVARYRVAAVPALVMLAVAVLPQRSSPRRSVSLKLGAFLALLALSFSLPWLRDGRAMLDRAEHATVAAALLEKERSAGRLDAATRAFVTASAAQPAIILVRNLRGIPFEAPQLSLMAAEESDRDFGLDSPVDLFVGAQLAARGGRCDVALQAAEAAAGSHLAWAIFDELQEPRLSTMDCLLTAGKFEEALAVIREVEQLRPGAAEPLAAEVALLDRAGLFASEQEAAARAELSALHDPLSVRYALARWHNRVGDGVRAEQQASELLALLPDAAVAHYERARALALLARSDEAVREYGEALVLAPRLPFPTQPLDASVKSALVTAADGETFSTAAEHAFRRGDLAQATSLAERATELFGTAAPSWHLERLRTFALAARPHG